MLQEGLDECARWGDLDSQAFLLVEAAELESQRGKTDDSMAILLQVLTHIFFVRYILTEEAAVNVLELRVKRAKTLETSTKRFRSSRIVQDSN